MSKSFSMSRHNKHSMRQLKNTNNKKRWKWKMTTIRPTLTLVSFDLCSFASVRTLKTLTRLFDTSSNWKCKRVQNISVPLNLLFSPSRSLFMPSHALSRQKPGDIVGGISTSFTIFGSYNSANKWAGWRKREREESENTPKIRCGRVFNCDTKSIKFNDKIQGTTKTTESTSMNIVVRTGGWEREWERVYP